MERDSAERGKLSLLRWKEYPGLSGWTLSGITGVLTIEQQREEGCRETEQECGPWRQREIAMMEPQARECRQPSEAGRAVNTLSPQAPGGSRALLTLLFNPLKLTEDF